MAYNRQKVLLTVLASVLKPIIRFCMRKSLYIQDLIECAKIMFIQTAVEEIEKAGDEVTISRLRVMTGIHRKDILRIHRAGETAENLAGFATRIIGTWLNDKRFCSKSGKPRVLTCETEDSEFSELVRTISTDVHPKSALYELERVGAVNRTANGVALKTVMYLPTGDPAKIYEFYARDATYLMDSVEENALDKPKTPNLHIMTEYDNIPVDEISDVRKWVLKQGSLFHKKVRDYVSKHDLDITPRKGKEGGGKMVIGSFSRAYEPPPGESE